MNNIVHEQTKILLAEDDRVLRTVLTDRLKEENYTVFEAEDGEQALEVALREHPSLILLDIIMPKMDGIEMLEKLRKDVWGKGAKVVMLTNLSDNVQRNKVEKSGVEDYLVKAEWDIEGIVRKVKEALRS